MRFSEQLVREKTESYLKQLISDVTKHPVNRLKASMRFEELGIDSVMVNRFNMMLESHFSGVPKTILFELQTIRALCDYLVSGYNDELLELLGLEPDDNEKVESRLEDFGEGEDSWPQVSAQAFSAPLLEYNSLPSSDIAIIGLSGRYPGAENVESFWHNLVEGVDSVTTIPEERWSWKAHFDEDPNRAKDGKIYCKWGAFLDSVDQFDAPFFGITPREARLMDPQERIFLECAWNTFEDAGYLPINNANSNTPNNNIGVFVGVTTSSYHELGYDEWGKGNYVTPNSSAWSLANRVSYLLGLNGPSIPVDTACSSSLTALHLAVESLKRGESDVALAGGVNLYLHPSKYLTMCQMRMLSQTGHCHSFGVNGDGFIPGEGVGAVLLKPLESARRDGDQIYGVIKSTSVNHGGRTSGYTVPNPVAQASLIESAIEKAGVNKTEISYIEAHGTGTALGDPIEISGLSKALSENSVAYSEGGGKVAVGSVKSNIGHLESAAGIAGITKVLMQMKHRKKSATLHSSPPNPNINFDSTPFYIQDKLEDWNTGEETLRAGISSFGAGGANAHVIIESYVDITRPDSTSLQRLVESQPVICLSARSETALQNYCSRLLSFIGSQIASLGGGNLLSRLAYTTQVGRSDFDKRVAFCAGSVEELETLIRGFMEAPCSIDGKVLWRGEEGGAPLALDVIESEEGEAFTAQLAKDRKWKSLAGLWVSGVSVPWRLCYTDTGPLKLSIPGYPFEHERYWVGDIIPSLYRRLPQAERAREHDFVIENRSSLFLQQFHVSLSSSAFYVQDHVIGGRRILPAAMILEIMRAVGTIAAEDQVNIVSSALFIKPIVFEEAEVLLNVVVKPEAKSIFIEIKGRGERETVYASGYANVMAECPKRHLNLEQLISEAQASYSADEIYRGFSAQDIEYGASFLGIKQLFAAEGYCLSEVVVDRGEYDTSTGLNWHPALLDCALQTVSGFFRGKQEGPYVPFQVNAIHSFCDIPDSVYISAKPQSLSESNLSFDIEIANRQGEVCMCLEGLKLRRLTAVQPGNILHKLTEVWHKAEPFERGGDSRSDHRIDAENLIVVTLASEKAQALLRGFTAPLKGEPLHILSANEGLSLNALGKQQRLNFNSLGEVTSALKALSSRLSGPIKVLLTIPFEAALGLNQLSDTAAGPVTTLLQAIIQTGDHLFEVVSLHDTTSDGVGFASNGLIGLYRSARLEQPGLSIKAILLDKAAWTDKRFAHRILTQWPVVPQHQQLLKLEGEQCFLPDIAISDVPSEYLDCNQWSRSPGVCLITGGAGDLGRHTVENLLKKSHYRLVLLGRSEWSDVDEQWRSSLEQSERVVYQRVDLGDAAAVADSISQIKESYGDIVGVIHGAGALSDRLLINKRWSDTEITFQGKVLGAINLDTALGNEPLDFFICYSSVSALTGNIGQGDYAAANASLNLFAEKRNQDVGTGCKHGRTIAISWPQWAGDAVNMSAGKAQTSAQSSVGMQPLPVTVAIDYLNQCLLLEGDVQYLFYGNEDKLSRFYSQLHRVSPLARKGVEKETATLKKDNLDLSSDALLPKVIAYVMEKIRVVTGLASDTLNSEESLERYGLDSIMVTELNGVLSEDLGPLPSTLYFEYETIGEIAEYIVEEHNEKISRCIGHSGDNSNAVGSVSEGGSKSKETHLAFSPTEERRPIVKKIPLADRLNQLQSNTEKDAVVESVAVIGIGGVYPQANSMKEFWSNLVDGRDCITTIPDDRWDMEHLYSEHKQPGKIYARWGGFVKDVDKFDPLFFGISPRDAAIMDPQERLFLQSVWHSIEDSGYTPETLAASDKGSDDGSVGVFVGVMYGEYHYYGVTEHQKGNPVMTNSSYASIANRVSYCLDFDGPSMAVDTMCSSSITSIQLAIDALKNGSCSVAVAGGVNLSIHPNKYLTLSQLNFASSDGKCRSFGVGGDGYVPGEGVGSVILKPLSQAIKDGDQIYGVIKGIALNHGGHSKGYSVPSPKAQKRVIQQALNSANISPGTIGYVEAHGTGTELGDPIELKALSDAYRADGELNTQQLGRCALGSVKSNVGHLESAAGVVALTKVLFQMKHRTLVPSIHSDTINPNLDFHNSPFKLQTALSEWLPLKTAEGKTLPLRAAISSFGAGGSNAHMIVEEFEEASIPSKDSDSPQLFVFSARTEYSLLSILNDFIDYSSEQIEQPAHTLSDVSETLKHGRVHFRFRAAVIADSFEGLKESLLVLVKQVKDRGWKDAASYTQNKPYQLGIVDEKNSKEFDSSFSIAHSGEEMAMSDSWVNGRISQFTRDKTFRKVSLPTYVFDLRRCWFKEIEKSSESQHDTSEIDGFIDASSLNPNQIVKQFNDGLISKAQAVTLLKQQESKYQSIA